ncbi:glycosyl hydrolase-related protein, partial [bacterium]|nr:glycosyl hydrolase-related protein [bacterium]
YNNAQRFPADINAALEYTKGIQERLKELSHVDHLLLMNGVDHLEAQGNVGEIINELNKRLDKGKLVHSTLPAYMDAVRTALDESNTQVDIVDGELRQASKEVMLAGTLSSRMYIKQANEVCQTELEKYAEPISTFARMLGFAYPKSFLDYTWKLLMQNHPHDSICGCSVDQVHREMIPRFDQVRQVTGELTQRALANISQCISTSGDTLVIYNPLNWARTDKVTATIDFPLGEKKRENPKADPDLDVKAIKITDNRGVSIPFAVISNSKIAKNVYSPIELPMVQIIRRFVIEFVAEDVPSFGYKTYSVEKCDQWQSWQDSFASQFAAEKAISNEFVKLSIHEGSMRLERLQPSVEGGACDLYDDINEFEDVGDAGDEYIYIKPNADLAVTSRCSNLQVSLASHNPISATLKVSCTMRIPGQSDTSGRSDVNVECPITSCMTITHGVPRVDIQTQIDNRASNHRLRVLFPTGIDSDVSHAEGQFDVLTRPIHSQYTANGDSEPQPQQRWVDVCNEQRGLCVINKGLPEYEVYTDDTRTIALTLLRCVGHMSHNSDMPGSLETPEAQCIGTHSFEYALYPHSGSWDSAQVWRQAHQHNIPLMVTQISAHQGCLPACHTFLEISHTGLVVSSVKMAENCEDRVIVRLYNTTNNTIDDACIRLNGAKCAYLLNLNEEITGNVRYEDDAVVLSAGAKEIVTLGFDLTKEIYSRRP